MRHPPFHLFAVCLFALAARGVADEPKHVVIYQEPGRFAGWPANNGIWSWDDEIVVGFRLGYHKDKGSGHPIDSSRPQSQQMARSVDGGETWQIAPASYQDADGKEPPLKPAPGGIDFTHPDFAFMFRMDGSNRGFSRFYWSNDRCRTWQGPFEFPKFDRPGILARTDVIVDGPQEMTAFLASAKDAGGEGWPFAARTADGGKTWKFLSWIGEQPGDGSYAIMPSTVRISPTELFTWIRCRTAENGKRVFNMKPYRSQDNGQTWQIESGNIIDNGGNPPHMIHLKDGRIALTYGYRHTPYGIRARLSSDGAKTWSNEIVLRDDGGVWDLGYPRTVQRADGKIVTAYYFNDRKQPERYIAATIWDPSAK